MPRTSLVIVVTTSRRAITHRPQAPGVHQESVPIAAQYLTAQLGILHPPCTGHALVAVGPSRGWCTPQTLLPASGCCEDAETHVQTHSHSSPTWGHIHVTMSIRREQSAHAAVAVANAWLWSASADMRSTLGERAQNVLTCGSCTCTSLYRS